MSNAVILRITADTLKHKLQLDPQAVITGMHFDSFDQVLSIRIDHPNLPDVDQDDAPPSVDYPGSDRPVVTRIPRSPAAPVTTQEDK